jgi:hypothetical protein
MDGKLEIKIVSYSVLTIKINFKLLNVWINKMKFNIIKIEFALLELLVYLVIQVLW